MRGELAERGQLYRLVITFDDQRSVPDSFCFERFEQAQSRVSRAVRRYATQGRIVAIALQRGRPVSTLRPRRWTGLAPSSDLAYQWVTEKRWGSDVVARIVSQQRRDATARPPSPGGAGARGGACAALPEPGDSRTPPARWHVAGVLALVCAAIMLAWLYQTGGNPKLLFALTQRRPSAVKHDLPFDARAVRDANQRGGAGLAPAPFGEDSP